MPSSVPAAGWREELLVLDPLKKLTSLLLLCATLLGVASLGLIFYRVLMFGDNHVGWNVLILLPIFGAIALLALFRRTQSNGSDGINYALIVFGIFSAILIAAVYHFNVLLPYEVWIERGMPERPF